MIKSFIKSFFWLPPLIGVIVYFQALSFGTAWGDDWIIQSDPSSRDFTRMLGGFYQNNIAGVHFMPIFFFQNYLINSICGMDIFPLSFRVYQITIHAIGCLITTMVLFKITKNKLISVLIVSLWTVHPLNVEILTRVGCSTAQLAGGVFCLIFVYCFLQINEMKTIKGKVLFVILGGLFFIAGMCTHEQYFFFPFVVLLINFYLYGKKIFIEKESIYFLIVPMIMIYVVYLIWRFYACGGAIIETSNELIKWTDMGSIKDILFRTFWLAPQILIHYFRLFFWPDFLAESKADWFKVGHSVWDPYSIFCELTVLTLVIGSINLYKKIPLFSIGMAWFFVSMILISQILPLFVMIDEHYCYVSILGIFISLFSLVIYYWKFINPKLLIAFMIPIFCLLTWRTLLYIPSGKSSLTLAIYMAQESPLWNRHALIAKALTLADSMNKVDELPKWLNNNNFEVEINKWFEKYFNLEPDLSFKFGPVQMPYNFYVYRGILKYLYMTNQLTKIPQVMNQAIKVKDNWCGWYEMVTFFKQAKYWEQSWFCLKKAIEKDPYFKYSYNLDFIETVMNTGTFTEAERLVKNYIKIKPRSSYPYLFAGMFYEQFKKHEEALKYFNEGISKDKIASSLDWDVYAYAALFLKLNNMLDKAEETLSIAISVDPLNKELKELKKELIKVKTLQKEHSEMSL